MKYRPNAFLARPPEHAGPTMAGSYSHPGFHTTGTQEVAACYAQAHVIVGWAYKPDKPIDDYPAIVTVDMDGLTPVADYDAVKSLWPDVLVILQEFFRMNPDSDENDLRSWLEYGGEDSDEPPERGGSTTDALFKMAGWRINEPHAALLSTLDGMPATPDVMVLLRNLADEKVKPGDDLLCVLADQYRYTEDVDPGRVTAVDYMAPYWPELVDWLVDEDDVKVAERLESLGWSVLGVEDVYNRSSNVATRQVYKARRKPRRPEYHGTTYRNLLSAAPRLGKRLPVPPPPFKEST